MIQPPEIFRRIYVRHGHRCPMSTLGGRLGLAAMRALAVTAEVELVAVCETDSCALDGIAETTGCQLADGRLSVEPKGVHALRLTAPGRRAVRVALSPLALDIAGRYRRLDELCARQRRAGVPAAELHALLLEKERTLQAVLEQLWTLADADLLEVEHADEP